MIQGKLIYRSVVKGIDLLTTLPADVELPMPKIRSASTTEDKKHLNRKKIELLG